MSPTWLVFPAAPSLWCSTDARRATSPPPNNRPSGRRRTGSTTSPTPLRRAPGCPGRTLGVLTWRRLGGLPLHLIAAGLQTSLEAGYVLIKMYAEPTEVDRHRALSTLGRHRQVDGMLVVAPELCE